MRARGHEVAIYDASAPAAARDAGSIAARIDAFGAELVGLHLKTLHVQPAYALARVLAERWPLVAGGPHATVRPEEPPAGHAQEWRCQPARGMKRGAAVA